MHDDLTPRERLARIVAEETGDGRRIVKFLVQVAEGELNSEGFQPCHRMDSAKELVKIGLTEFEDYIHANSTPQKPRARRTSAPDADISPEIAQAREQLAEYARELTQDGRTVIRMYSEVMEGERNDEGFKPHHRIAAARELIKRGFDSDYSYAHEARQSQPLAPSVDDDSVAEPTQQATEDANDGYTPEEQAQIQKVLDRIDRIVEEADPSDYEEEESSDRRIDYSMWDIIDSLPEPEITEEHARIGAALFHEAVEKQRLWRESGVKIPDPPEGLTRYDDP